MTEDELLIFVYGVAFGMYLMLAFVIIAEYRRDSRVEKALKRAEDKERAARQEALLAESAATRAALKERP